VGVSSYDKGFSHAESTLQSAEDPQYRAGTQPSPTRRVGRGPSLCKQMRRPTQLALVCTRARPAATRASAQPLAVKRAAIGRIGPLVRVRAERIALSLRQILRQVRAPVAVVVR